MATRTFTIVLEEGPDVYYVARCVEIPEAISRGKTKPSEPPLETNHKLSPRMLPPLNDYD